MGMYTEVMFAAEVDEEAFNIFRAVKDTGDLPEIDHPFFKTARGEMLFGHGSSYYFPGACHFTTETDALGAPIYSVSLRANLKNYDDEIGLFFDWVTPHVKEGAGARQFIGYSIYEESETPTLYYADADDAGVSR